MTALMTGWTALARDHEDRADLRVWTFSPERAEALRRAVEGRSRLPARGLGSRLSVEAMPARALDLRLMTLLRSWSHADQLPDVVELEVLSAAKFLDDPPQVLGLLPLEGYLARSHALAQALPAARLDAWRRHGHLYGLPAEVHPTTLTYRRDHGA